MEPLGCLDRTQCELYWQRAKVWISSNSYYRVQLSSDSVIETYGPLAGRMELAYRVLKIPDGAGGARITVAAECGNVFRCIPAVMRRSSHSSDSRARAAERTHTEPNSS